MKVRILIIDDEDLFREDLASILDQHGYKCRTARTGEAGLVLAEEFSPDVVLCDVVLPEMGGVEVLGELGERAPGTSVIMITAYGSVETAVEAFRKGAVDYVMKPFLIADILQKIERLINHKSLDREVRLLRREISETIEDRPMVCESDPMKKVIELMRKVAPTKSVVLLQGESGTGKELAARAIHRMSGGAAFPFVAINCAGIPEHLLESELFGHIRGAFTGAVEDREGFFELAGEGTIFLDELSEMSITLQTKLLRVLEEREFTKVGGRRPIALKARIVVSANRPLKELVDEGRFREDLFFRVAVFEILLPLLKERKSDIPRLITHFVQKFNKELKKNCLGADMDVVRRLIAYSWPGNVRELKNVIERAMILNDADFITLKHLPPGLAGTGEPPPLSDSLKEAVRAYEREHIRSVLEDAGGNREEAARRLAINPSTLYRKMSDLGLE